MSGKPLKFNQASQPGRAGFTLLELLTALAVLGVASTIFLRLYSSSNSLAASSLSHEIALNIAEEYLTEIQARPDNFVWPDYDTIPPGEPQSLRTIEDGPLPATFTKPPTTLPNVVRANNRDRALYADFTWEAFVVLPPGPAQHVELMVEVSWTDGGRLRRFSMNSLVPRSHGGNGGRGS